jgi:hypothetical protein
MLQLEMQRISGHFLYQVGASLHPLTTMRDETSKADARAMLYTAQLWLDNILGAYEVFRLRACWSKGNDLRQRVKTMMEQLDKTGDEALQSSPHGDVNAAWGAPVGFLDAFFMRSAAQEFETLLAAELSVSDLYAVHKKRAFDTTVLAERGAEIFPFELVTKVPDVAHDAAPAGRCLAFELNTACGFHLHRINEAVLRKYFDVVTSGATPPKERTIGAYLREFATLGKGDAKVLDALKSLKDLYRNPLMHPDHIIESTDEAISLHGAIQSVVVHMLKEIP